MGQVIDLAGPGAIEIAWETYAAIARELGDDPRLMSDRRFNERLARAHETWRRLFLRAGR